MHSTLNIPTGHTLFCVSDLHLSPETPKTLERFQEWLLERAHASHHLLILGDLFELWLGDDAQDDFTQTVAAMLRKASLRSTIGFIHGNRDFLLGQEFAKQSGITIYPAYVLALLGDYRVCFSHGDAYCTDDTQYQAFRNMSRNSTWQEQVLKLPLSERKALGAKIRDESVQHKSNTALSIQDVNPSAIQQAFAGILFDEAFQTHHPKCDVLVHGHTHRPAVHIGGVSGEFCNESDSMQFELQSGMRVVLPDWRCDVINSISCQPHRLITFGETTLNHQAKFPILITRTQ